MPEARVAGINLHFDTAGSGEPVLLIHGLGSSSRDWELQFSAFAESHKVVAVDLRGHGRSDKPPGPYSIPLFADDVAGLMDTLGIASAHVVGLSLGGMVAFELAVSRPACVRSLVIVNSAPACIVRTSRERLLLLQRQVIARLLGMQGIGRYLSRRLFPKPGQARLRQQLEARFAANDPRAYRSALRAMATGWTVEDRLGELRCPVLVISADHDYTPVAEKAAYVARIRGAKLLVIRDSRHATPADQPEEFNRVVLSFIDGDSRRPATMPARTS